MGYIIGLTILMCIITTLGDFFLKSAVESETHKILFLVLCSLSYGSTAFGWFYVAQEMKLSVLGIFYSVAVAIGCIGIGVLFFGETLTSREIIGILLGFASIIFIV